MIRASLSLNILLAAALTAATAITIHPEASAQTKAAAAPAAAKAPKTKGKGVTESPNEPTSPDDIPGLTDRNTCPIALFGADGKTPNPDAVDMMQKELIIHHIYIGQGDATYIRTPSIPGTTGTGPGQSLFGNPGLSILIDGGIPGNQTAIATLLLVCYNTNAVDYMVISHPHIDHFGGAVELMKLTPAVAPTLGKKSSFFITKGVYINGYTPENLPADQPPLLKKFNLPKGANTIVDNDFFNAEAQIEVGLAAIINAGVKKATPAGSQFKNQGETLPFGKGAFFANTPNGADKVSFNVIVRNGQVAGQPQDMAIFKKGPDKKPLVGMLVDPNAVSSGIHINFGNFDYLTMGDLNGDSPNIEQVLLNAKVLSKMDVVKASHHGSDTANTTPYLETVNPYLFVISAGDAGSNLASFHLPRAEPVTAMHGIVSSKSLGSPARPGMVLMMSCGAGDIFPDNKYCEAVMQEDIKKEGAKTGGNKSAFDFEHGTTVAGGLATGLPNFKNAQGDVIIRTNGSQYTVTTPHNPDNLSPTIATAKPGTVPSIMIPAEPRTTLGPFQAAVK
jgi:beta-lactamase superfamily II metal-dependent hydrolase